MNYYFNSKQIEINSTLVLYPVDEVKIIFSPTLIDGDTLNSSFISIGGKDKFLEDIKFLDNDVLTYVVHHSKMTISANNIFYALSNNELVDEKEPKYYFKNNDCTMELSNNKEYSPNKSGLAPVFCFKITNSPEIRIECTRKICLLFRNTEFVDLISKTMHIEFRLVEIENKLTQQHHHHEDIHIVNTVANEDLNRSFRGLRVLDKEMEEYVGKMDVDAARQGNGALNLTEAIRANLDTIYHMIEKKGLTRPEIVSPFLKYVSTEPTIQQELQRVDPDTLVLMERMVDPKYQEALKKLFGEDENIVNLKMTTPTRSLLSLKATWSFIKSKVISFISSLKDILITKVKETGSEVKNALQDKLKSEVKEFFTRSDVAEYMDRASEVLGFKHKEPNVMIPDKEEKKGN